MSVETTRPATTVTGGGVTVSDEFTGGAAAALADNADTSYIIFTTGDHPFFTFTEPTGIPGTAIVKQGRLRARMRKVGTDTPLVFNWNLSDANNNMFGSNQNRPVAATTFTTETVLLDETGDDYARVIPTDLRADMGAHAAGSEATVHMAALYFDTVYVTRPVADVAAPAGTQSSDTTPTVSWTNTLDTDGGPQVRFEVKFFTSAQANPSAGSSPNESGIVTSGATSWTPTSSLADGAWLVYVRVAQMVNGELHWSAWGSATATSFSSFTMAVNRPGVPTMTLTSQSASGRIQVALDDTAGSATTDFFETQVSNDGTTWLALRTDEGGGLSTPSGGTATEYDYEAPNGGTRSFRTRALKENPGNVFAVSAWSSTQTSSWTSSSWWVKATGTPSLSMAVFVKSQPGSTRVGRAGLFQPLGAEHPIAVLDKRQSASGEIVFRFMTDADRDAFEALMDDSSVVLIQAPANTQDWPDRFCALGDYERERAIDKSTGVYSFDSVQWTEVERP